MTDTLNTESFTRLAPLMIVATHVSKRSVITTPRRHQWMQPHGMSITISANGPYIVAGDVPLSTQTVIVDANGDSIDWQQGETTERPTRSVAVASRAPSRSATART
ncbi:MAG: hypothetical protein ABIR68_15745 [Ilumatobacteraceae bacterium]